MLTLQEAGVIGVTGTETWEAVTDRVIFGHFCSQEGEGEAQAPLLL